MSKTPAWLGLSVVAVGVAVGLVFLVTGRKDVVVIPLGDKSMRPTLKAKIEEKTEFTVDPTWLDDPKRGDVVAFIPPGSSTPTAVRAVALPGDRLAVREQRFLVNGKRSPAVSRLMGQKDIPEFVCPRDCFYLLTDTFVGKGVDSVKYGPVPSWRVLGAVEF